MNDTPNDYKSLYNQFRQDLKGQPLEMYYDEDELIMVFDQASDYNDCHTQLNVLMLGYKLYPGSEALAVRQGFFLLNNQQINTTIFDYFMLCNSNRQGLMWEILRLKANAHDPATVAEELSQLVEQYDFNEDEEIIQFANLIDLALCDDWLAQHYNEFIDKCKYKDTAISECMRVLRINYVDIAIQLGEELTKIDPFNHDSWTKLAEVNRDANRIDDGLAAIEYAKALAPDDYMQQFVEAQLLATQNPGSREAIQLLKNVIKAAPGMIEAKFALSDLYACIGRRDLAIQIWEDELENPETGFAAEYRIKSLQEPNPDFIIPENCQTEDDLENTLRQLNDENQQETPLANISLMEAFDKQHGLYKLAGDYIKLLYENNMLDELIDFMERERPGNSPELRFEASSLPIYAATLLRVGRYDDAEKVAKEYIVNAAKLCTTTQLRITFAGVKIALNYIIDRALEGNYDRNRDPISESLS